MYRKRILYIQKQYKKKNLNNLKNVYFKTQNNLGPVCFREQFLSYEFSPIHFRSMAVSCTVRLTETYSGLSHLPVSFTTGDN